MSISTCPESLREMTMGSGGLITGAIKAFKSIKQGLGSI